MPVVMFKVLEIVPIFIWFLRTKGRTSLRLDERSVEPITNVIILLEDLTDSYVVVL